MSVFINKLLCNHFEYTQYLELALDRSLTYIYLLVCDWTVHK